MSRAVLVAASIALLAAAAPPQAQWRRLDSPNFIVVGEVGAGELRDIAVKFEGFREILGRLLNERVTSTPVPTVVLVFRGEATFRPFMPTYQGKRVEVGGLFVPRRDVNYIAMVSDGNDERLRVIFHEYAHLLVSNTGQRVPVWLNEGLAEYYSTFELQRGGRDAIIGRIIDGHLQRLNSTGLLKLPDLLSVDHQSPLYNEGSRRSVFYAQAWALTHLILRSEPSRVPQLTEYLNQLSRGAGPVEAWQRAFGSQDLARELEMYIRRQAFTATLYKFTDRLAAFAAESAQVPPAELHAYLADFLVQSGAHDQAADRLATAAKIDPENVRVRLVRASLDLARQNHDAGEKTVRTLGDSPDWFLNYQAGVGLVAAIEGRRGTASAADLDIARGFFSRAKNGHPEFANALARMAALELHSTSGPTAATRASLENARAIAPGRHEYAMLLAQVLARQSEFAAARAVLGPLITPLYPEEVRASARSLMGTIATVESRLAARSSPAAGSTPSSTASTSGPPAPGEPVVRPVFRELRPGEERLEGALENIECVASKGITFRVRTKTESVAVTAADFSTVDFITYRNDLKGSISCGPVSPALNVYVTFKTGTTAGSKIAIAIEFPPK